jgi:hypothetical protein
MGEPHCGVKEHKKESTDKESQKGIHNNSKEQQESQKGIHNNSKEQQE